MVTRTTSRRSCRTIGGSTAALTVFLGARYEIIGNWHEKDDLLANFIIADGGHHVVPNAEVAAKLPPGVIALNRTLLASDVGVSSALIHTDRNNISPRGGFAWRLDESNKTVLRGGFGLFHPTVAVQGVRDLLATNEFRYSNTRRGGATLQHGFSEGAPVAGSRRLRQRRNRPRHPESGHLPVQPDSGAGAAGRPRRARELPRLDDAEAARDEVLQRSARQHDALRSYDPTPTTTGAPAPVSLREHVHECDGKSRERASSTPCSSNCSVAGRAGLRSTSPIRWRTLTATPRTRGTAASGVIQFDSFDIEKDRGPDPNVVKHRLVANATWDIPVGHGRTHGATMPGWSDALFGGWTVSTIVQARSGPNLTPFFSGFYTTSPWNTGQGARRYRLLL